MKNSTVLNDLRMLILIVVGSALLIFWQNLLGVKIEGTMAARTGYMIGVILFARLVCKYGTRSI